MNAYFDRNNEFNSNRRIIEAYFTESVRQPSAAWKASKALLSMLEALLALFTCAKAKCIFKALSVAACLVGFIGIIGAMEQGTLGLGIGFLAGMALVGIEFLCLRRRPQ